MYKLVWIVTCAFLMGILFLGMSQLQNMHHETMEIKQAMNLSARVLVNAVSRAPGTMETLAQGYRKAGDSMVEVDGDLLLQEFRTLLLLNIRKEKQRQHMLEHIAIKVLVYPDRFYTAGKEDVWSPPWFFTLQQGTQLLYINTRDETVYRYDDAGNKLSSTLTQQGITLAQRNREILQQLNRVVGAYTAREGRGKAIRIFNPEEPDPVYRHQYGYFNPLDGISFFAVYADAPVFWLGHQEVMFPRQAITGYTLRMPE